MQSIKATKPAFFIGQSILWKRYLGGYRSEMRIKAEIVYLHAKTAQIKAFRKDGTFSLHNVKYSALSAAE